MRKYKGEFNRNAIKQFTQAWGQPFRKKAPKKQKESILQRDIIKALHVSGIGYFFRIRNGATFDPRAGIHRANTAEKGIPDIIGITTAGRFVAIEVKYLEKLENKKKLTFTVKISDEQKDFLEKIERLSGLSGIAFSIEDALNIARDNQILSPRHPRTYGHKTKEWRAAYEEKYKAAKAKLVAARKDPVNKMLEMVNPEILEQRMQDQQHESGTPSQSASLSNQCPPQEDQSD